MLVQHCRITQHVISKAERNLYDFPRFLSLLIQPNDVVNKEIQPWMSGKDFGK